MQVKYYWLTKIIDSAKRLRDLEGVQSAIEIIGSIQNITLTQLAKNKRILFVEGSDDYKIIRRFAKKLSYNDLSNGLDITAVESKGFSSWEKIKSFAWGFKAAFNETLSVAAIFDRDYWCDEEIIEIERKLSSEINYVHIHRTKEIENYLLRPDILLRLLEKLLKEKQGRSGKKQINPVAVVELLDSITKSNKAKVLSQYLAKRNNYLKKLSKKDEAVLHEETLSIFEGKWESIYSRMDIIHGKDTLGTLRANLQKQYGVTLTIFRIIDEFKKKKYIKIYV